MDINQAIAYFMTTLQTEQLSSNSLRAYHQDLTQFALKVGKSSLNELHYEDFQNYFLSISQLKPTSIKRKRTVMHRFFKFCYKRNLSSEKLYEYIDPVRLRKTSMPKDVLTQQEIYDLFNYLQQQKQAHLLKIENPYYEYLYYCCIRNILLIHILLYTGCRAHEAVSLKKTAIDFKTHTLTLITKGKKYNQIPIHQELVKAFNQYYEDIDLLKTSPVSTMLESDYLFPSKQNIKTHLSTRTLHDLMHTLSTLLNKHIHAHLFRHTFASYCIAAQMDISTIASLISHSNPSITLSIYTHEINASNKQEQMKKLNFNVVNLDA